MSKKQIKAFSLIEISVVLLIISLFIAAISSGKLLLDRSNSIRLQQTIQNQLESQEYYSEKSFEINAQDIIEACGSDPSDKAIADFLYTGLTLSNGGCCSDATNLDSLCCDDDNNNICTACSGTGQPECLNI